MRRLRRPAADERGIALVLAVVVLAVMAMGVTTVITFATSNLSTSSRANSSEAALFAAEGGVADALARLNTAADPRVGTLLPSTTITVGEATVTYSGAYDAPTGRWTITSTATQPSRVGATAPVSRTIVDQAAVSSDVATVASNPAWNYLYADRPDGCTTLNTGVQVRQPMYVRNSLCLSNNVKIFSAAGTLQVGGSAGITVNGSAMIGVAANGTLQEALPVLKVASQGCRFSNQAYSWPCKAANPNVGQRVSAATQTNALDPVSKPTIDLAARYNDASPGPKNPCGPGSFGLAANFFDSNTVPLDKTTPTRDLFPVSSYDCITPTGRLKWQPGNPGTLAISGTILIDGSITTTSGKRVVVSGRGTIYASGSVSFASNVRICGMWDVVAGTCDWDDWDPEQNMLILVGASHNNLPSTSINLPSTNHFQGGLYGGRTIISASNAITQGPQIGHELQFNSASGSLFLPFTTLPPGAPGSASLKVAPVPGTGHEI